MFWRRLFRGRSRPLPRLSSWPRFQGWGSSRRWRWSPSSVQSSDFRVWIPWSSTAACAPPSINPATRASTDLSCGIATPLSGGSSSRPNGTCVSMRGGAMSLESAGGWPVEELLVMERSRQPGSSFEYPWRFSEDAPRTNLTLLSRRAANSLQRSRETAARFIVPGGDSGVRGRRCPSAYQTPIA